MRIRWLGVLAAPGLWGCAGLAVAEPDPRGKPERLPAETEKLADAAIAVGPGSGESFRDRLADGQPCPDCLEMVVVPAGSFMMGSPVSNRRRA